ncbi:MAG: hypothetical protein QOF39_2190 [Frankiales bacterium]|nr:hypothetical protein [Frankiales bacterium]
MVRATTPTLWLSQVPEADALLASSPLALLIGMVLDQQIPLEKAFTSPYVLSQRLGCDLDAADLAGRDPEELATIFATPPALHRFPGAMSARVQALCQAVVSDYAGDAAAVWRTATDGPELLRRIKALPGFGEQKAKIFVALLGKQFGVTPQGWQTSAGAYGETGSLLSVADIRDAASLQQVRAYKKQAKAAAAAARSATT